MLLWIISLVLVVLLLIASQLLTNLINSLMPVLAALLTPTIAAVAVLIAYEQFVINRRQYRLALFEKRYAIFNATAKFIALILQQANVSVQECIQFLQDTRDDQFLFGQEVADFIKEVYEHATALHAHMAMGAAHAQQAQDVNEWFAGKIDEARKIFGKYLDFRKP